MSINIHEFMNEIYGLERQDDSMRCNIGRYVISHAPNRCTAVEVMKAFSYNKKQVISEFERIVRRNKRLSNPYTISYDINTLAIRYRRR